MKKERKLYRNGIVAFFITVMLISTVTAIPLSNKEAVDGAISKNEKKQSINDFLNDIKTLLEFLKQYNIFDILKGRFLIRNMNTLFIDDLTIDQAWNYYNDTNVRDNITSQRLKIKNEINKYPNYQLWKDFFMIDDTLSFDKIKERIESLHVGQILYDIQNLQKISDNLQEFDYNFNSTIEKFLLLYKDCNDSNDWLSQIELFYPLIDFICGALTLISFIWTIPLVILFGERGLRIACCLTIIFLTPFISILSFYVGMCEMFKHDGALLEEIISKMAKDGIAGCITMILKEVFDGNWYSIGLEYILNQFHLTKAITTCYGWVFETKETKPLINEIFYIKKESGDTGFCMWIIDYDTVYTNFPKVSEEYRDYLQVGFDFNNDNEPDYWSNLYQQYNTLGYPIYKEFWFNLPNGNHIINCWIRDNWGIVSEKTAFSIKIQKSLDIKESKNSFTLLNLFSFF